jgi:hypothetical protein
VLWNKADGYKKTEDWTNLTATLEQLAKLQPNFITFWKYQSWNLTYNVSVQFDDYRDRYYYVIRGMKFLQDGLRYNLDHPHLLAEMGWFIGHKIGRADEAVQYRRLFKADDDFHPADRPPEQRDSWLVSKEWYEKAVEAVDFKGKSLGGKSPREFYSNPAKSQINYAEAIEKEGEFDKARLAWAQGGEEWREFGERVIEHSSGVPLRLGDEPRLTKEVARLRAKLDELGPKARTALLEEKRQSLTPDERRRIDTPSEELSEEDAGQLYLVQEKMSVTDVEVAERIARERPESAKQALALAREISETEQTLRFTQNYKETANFDYWQLRCDFEQTENALDARRKMHLAEVAARAANPVEAKRLYEEGFAKWRLLIDEFPKILEDETVVGSDLIDYFKRYRDALDQLGETLDERFPLWDVLEAFDQEDEFAKELARHRQR